MDRFGCNRDPGYTDVHTDIDMCGRDVRCSCADACNQRHRDPAKTCDVRNSLSLMGIVERESAMVNSGDSSLRLQVQRCSRSTQFRDMQPSASAQKVVSYVPHLSVVKAIYVERILPVCLCVTRRVN
jgi:hypothetical protein